MNKPFTLEVTYKTKGDDAYEWGHPDREIEAFVGIEPWAMDTERDTGDRSISFAFDSRDEVDEAAEVLAAQFNVKTQIFDWTVADPPKRIA